MSAVEEREVIRQSLHEHQRELREAVHELKLAAASYASPRDPIREQPIKWMIAALALGLWLGWRR
jgi:type VI protein secretion system component VasF